MCHIEYFLPKNQTERKYIFELAKKQEPIWRILRGKGVGGCEVLPKQMVLKKLCFSP